MAPKLPDKSTLLLAAGALIGAVLAASGLLEADRDTLPPGVIATVNGSPIYARQFQAYVDTLQQDRREPLTRDDRSQVLDRMIEERLMIQRGLDRGLAETDGAVRKAIVDAMVEDLLAQVAASPPDETELQAFFQANPAYFSGPDLLLVDRMVFSGDDAAQRAGQAHAALAQRGFDEVKAAFADREVLSLPATPLPLNRLQNYLGPHQSGAAAQLAPGHYTPVMTEGDRRVILYCRDRQDAPTPAFGQVREQVSREFQRRQGDDRLRQYLDALRTDARVRIDHALLAAQ